MGVWKVAIRDTPVPVPKQSNVGTDQNAVRATTKWATSLRLEPSGRNDPYGAPASMQQLPAEQYGARAKAASGILTRIRLRYSQWEDDSKVAGTLSQFAKHFAGTLPTTEDLNQLDEVLSVYVQNLQARQQRRETLRAARSNPPGRVPAHRADSAPPPGTFGAASGSLPRAGPGIAATREASLARSSGPQRGAGSQGHTTQPRRGMHTPKTAGSGGGRAVREIDVRKDEWHAVTMLADQRVQEADSAARASAKRVGEETRVTLRGQQAQLEVLFSAERDRERQEARDQAEQRRLWEEKEGDRARALAGWKEEDKIRSKLARKTWIKAATDEVLEVRAEDRRTNQEVQRLIAEDRQKALDFKARLRAESLSIIEADKVRQGAKYVQEQQEVEKDQEDVAAYNRLLAQREEARAAEMREIKKRQDAQAGKAAEMGAAANVAAAADELRAEKAQRLRLAKEDANTAKKAADAALRAADIQGARASQLQGIRRQEGEEMRRNREEAAAGKALHAKAVRDEEERVAARRARDQAHRRDIEKQMGYNHKVLKDGAGARGMTLFERQYNADDLRAAGRL